MSALDWNQLGTFIALASIISGGVSAGINYLVEYRKEKEKRGADVAKEQTELHSAFIYNVRILVATLGSLLSLPQTKAKRNYRNRRSKDQDYCRQDRPAVTE